MLTSEKLHGVIAAIVTPFDKNDQVDEAALRKITRHIIDKGCHGIMATGGTGEFPHLSAEERKLVIQIVVDEAQEQVPIIPGTAACSTAEAILHSQNAQDAGADAVIVTAPFYFGLPKESLLRHYQDLISALDIPVVLYNNPLYTGNNLTPALIAELAGNEGVIGLKQSDANLGELVHVIHLVGERIAICTGIDSQWYPALCAGAKGIFSSAANIVPKEMAAIYELVKQGEYEEARKLHYRLQSLNRFLEYDPGYVSPCKEALTMMGMPAGKVRRPLPDLTTEERTGLHRALKALGLI